MCVRGEGARGCSEVCFGPLSLALVGCQFTVLAGPKDSDSFFGDFRVPLVIYNESVPLFLHFRSSIGNFPLPFRALHYHYLTL